MSHRRKKAIAKKEEVARLREEKKLMNRIVRAYDEHPKSVIGTVVLVLLLSFVFYQAATSAPPFDYVQCFDGGVAQHKHVGLLIQIGERFGDVNLKFIRIPENMGVASSCMYPIHTHGVSGERGPYYTQIHIESPYTHSYTLGDLFEVWGESLDYPSASGIYFGSDGVSFYRSSNVELWLRYGPVVQPANETYTTSVLNRDYQNYVMQDKDIVEIIVHEPYTTVECPYFPYTDPDGPGCEP